MGLVEIKKNISKCIWVSHFWRLATTQVENLGTWEPLLGCRKLLDRESDFGQDGKEKVPKSLKRFNFELVTMKDPNLGILSFGMLKINYPIGVV